MRSMENAQYQQPPQNQFSNQNSTFNHIRKDPPLDDTTNVHPDKKQKSLYAH